MEIKFSVYAKESVLIGKNGKKEKITCNSTLKIVIIFEQCGWLNEYNLTLALFALTRNDVFYIPFPDVSMSESDKLGKYTK